jgi:hypothetical protein
MPEGCLPCRPDCNAKRRNSRCHTKHARKAEGTSWLEVLSTTNHVVEDVSSIMKEETDQLIAERNARQEAENARFDEERAEYAKDAESIYKQRRLSIVSTVNEQFILSYLLISNDKACGL